VVIIIITIKAKRLSSLIEKHLFYY